FVAENFTGTEGEYVKLEDTVKGFKEIIEGKHDDLPEQAFLMVGTIEDARRKAEAMKAEESSSVGAVETSEEAHVVSSAAGQ
ncbi:MAG: hypothetical protein ACE5HV_05570, partial [Acidobacteriota bacterium]